MEKCLIKLFVTEIHTQCVSQSEFITKCPNGGNVAIITELSIPGCILKRSSFGSVILVLL